MAQVLIHKKSDGEPVGIVTQTGGVHYLPGHAAMEREGMSLSQDRSPQVPWVVFVERMRSRTSHKDFWGASASSKIAPRILEDERTKFFSAENSKTPETP